MTGQARTRALFAVATAGTAVVVGCVLLLVARGRSIDVLYGLWVMLNAPTAALSLWIAHLVLRRFPRHGAGRLLLAMGLASVLHVVVATTADLRLVAAGQSDPLVGDHGLTPAALPLQASVPLLLMNVLWVPTAISATLLVAYFPDGELRGRRLRWIPVAAAAAATLLITATAVDAWPTADWVDPADAPPLLGPLFLAGGILTLAVVVGGIVSFAGRWRTSGAERRRFEAVGGVLVIVVLLGVLTYPWPQVWQPLVHVGFVLFLGTYGAATSRYRLHDVEPVLGKGAVAVALSVLAVLTYLAVVVGLGRIVGARTDNPLLPLVAVASIALLVEPTRRLLRRGTDRLLYGNGAEPADVLARVTGRSADPGVDPATVTEVADLLVRATGARRVEIELDVVDTAPMRVGAGPDAAGPPLARAPVRDRGEIRLYAHAPRDLRPGAVDLLHDVARILSMLVDNDRLARRLTDELERSRTSRQRLVEAQEHARRELERDVHDGAQARLVAIRMHLGALRGETGADGATPVGAQLDHVCTQVDAAIRDLRDLARGLHPPVLDQLGLAAAVRAHVRDASLPVSIVDTGTGRYGRPVESAAYFVSIEAIQNALRHADARTISVEIAHEPTGLRVRVADDGRGYDPGTATGTGLVGIRDRVTALGGTVEVRAAAGAGTRLTVTIPAPVVQASSAER